MDARNALRNIRLYLFDLDGTLYLGDRLFPFTRALLKAIRERGGRYLFMTNNSSKSVTDYVKKLERLGIPAQPGDFVTSAQATARYLHAHHEGATLYVCGTASLKEELRAEGFAVTEEGDGADLILMGYDTELTFQKLDQVCRQLCTREMPYIATHPDLVCPTEYGSVPDCGGVCEMVYNATGKRPVVIGKPSPRMPLLAMERAGVSPAETAVVGDRIYTDVKSGQAAGALGVLVMSGETTPAILEQSPDKPDLILADAGDILKYLKEDAP